MLRPVGLLAVLTILVSAPLGFAAANPLLVERDRKPGAVGAGWGYPYYGQAPFTTRSSSDCGYMTARVRQGDKFVFRRVWRCW